MCRQKGKWQQMALTIISPLQVKLMRNETPLYQIAGQPAADTAFFP
jgi:hypothetical protein